MATKKQIDVEAELNSLAIKPEKETNSEPDVKADVPEKFRNKSFEDVIDAYKNLESEYGRRSNEVGELRRLTDELLGLQLKRNKEEPVKAPEIKPEALYEDPTTVINDAVSSSPKIKELEDQIRLNTLDRERAKFETKHSDWRNVMTSSDFQEWVGKSPLRAQMLRNADQNYDYALGGELLDLYKEVKQVDITRKEQEAKSKQEEDLKASMTERGSTGHSSKKVFNRSELINLKLRDPAKYQALYPEIYQAYKENRVK